MSNLDVSLRLKMVNQLGAGASAAKKDLAGVKEAASKLGSGSGAAKLGTDLSKAGAGAKAAKRDIADLKAATDRLGASSGIQRFNEGMAKGLRDAREQLKVRERLARQTEREQQRASAAAAKAAAAEARAARANPGMGAAAALGAGVLARRLIAPLGGAYLGKKALDSSVGFEAGMAEVAKKVDINGPGDLAYLDKLIRRMALDLGIARTEMAGLTAEAGASGVAFADLEGFMKLTGKAAIGWDMVPREASQALAEIKTGLRMTIPEMEVLADKINALGDNSAAKERDIVEMFQRSGAAAKASGVDIDTSLAFLTGAKAMGIQPEIGARWWGVFTSKFAAGFKGKQSGEALKELGLDEKTLAAGMRSKPFETLMDFMERLEKSPNKTKLAVALLGNEWFDETLRISQGLDEIRKQRDMLRDPTKWRGSLDKGLAIQLGTTKNHLERLKVLASEVGDRLSHWALPPINNGIEWLIEKFDALTNKSTVFSRNMAWLQGRFPQWFGPKEAGPAPDKAPDNNPWAGLAQKRTAQASALQAEADAAAKEADAAPTKTADDKKKQAALKQRADTLRRLAAGERRSAGMSAARDSTGQEEGDAMAAGMRAKRAADEGAWSDQVDALLFERRMLKDKVVEGRSRSALQSQFAFKQADDKARQHLGTDQVDRADRLATLYAGLAAQQRVAGDAKSTPRARVEARANVSRLQNDLKEELGKGDLDEPLRRAMERYIRTLNQEGSKAVDEARKIAEELIRTLSIEAHPKITPQYQTGGGFGGEPTSPPPTPGKQSSLGGSSTTVHQHITGADPRAIARASQREQDRAIRQANAGALHDLGSWA